jgi:hypothetical protein
MLAAAGVGGVAAGALIGHQMGNPLLSRLVLNLHLLIDDR